MEKENNSKESESVKLQTDFNSLEKKFSQFHGNNIYKDKIVSTGDGVITRKQETKGMNQIVHYTLYKKGQKETLHLVATTSADLNLDQNKKLTKSETFKLNSGIGKDNETSSKIAYSSDPEQNKTILKAILSNASKLEIKNNENQLNKQKADAKKLKDIEERFSQNDKDAAEDLLNQTA